MKEKKWELNKDAGKSKGIPESTSKRRERRLAAGKRSGKMRRMQEFCSFWIFRGASAKLSRCADIFTVSAKLSSNRGAAASLTLRAPLVPSLVCIYTPCRRGKSMHRPCCIAWWRCKKRAMYFPRAQKHENVAFDALNSTNISAAFWYNTRATKKHILYSWYHGRIDNSENLHALFVDSLILRCKSS